LTAIVLFPAACRVARRLAPIPRSPLHEAAPALAWSAAGLLTYWCMNANHAYAWGLSLTIIAALLALVLFAAGLLLSERAYRLGGMALLGLGVALVFFVDVWSFDPLYRILSFIVLGVVLLLIGYFYNRFEEKLRQWL
jgi:uncharacterized membrane protein